MYTGSTNGTREVAGDSTKELGESMGENDQNALHYYMQVSNFQIIKKYFS